MVMVRMRAKQRDDIYTQVSALCEDLSCFVVACLRWAELSVEDLRRQMSDSTISALLGNSVDTCLSEIDARAGENSSAASNQHVVVGPFSVLRPGASTGHRATPSREIPASTWPPQLHMPSGPAGYQNSGEIGTTLPLSEFYDIGTTFDWNDTLQWDDLFELGLDNTLDPFNSAIDPSLAFKSGGPTESSFAVMQSSLTFSNLPASKNPPSAGSIPGQLLPSAPSSRLLTEEVLRLAPSLLKHFKKNVIEHICALPITAKSPFEIVNLSIAVDSLAQLTFLESSRVTFAKCAGLYSLLAVSAFHLSRNTQYSTDSDCSPERLESISSAARDRAAEDLQRSIKEESRDPNKAKYKDQVAAAMNLMTYAVCLVVTSL